MDVLLTVLSRDESGAETADPRRTLRLSGCSRLVASYRAGRWDDAAAEVIPLDADRLRELLRRNGGTPIYGWDFVDAEQSWTTVAAAAQPGPATRWCRRPSPHPLPGPAGPSAPRRAHLVLRPCGGRRQWASARPRRVHRRRGALVGCHVRRRAVRPRARHRGPRV